MKSRLLAPVTATSRLPATLPVPPPARLGVVLWLGLVGSVAWAGCGSGTEMRYYCDASGCFDCDGYGCTSVQAPTKTACRGNVSCPAGAVCTTSGCSSACSDAVACPRGEVCKAGLCTAPSSSAGTPKECTSKEDCGAGKTCTIQGSCAACGGTSGPCPCSASASATSGCESGQTCVAGACTANANTCKFSSECAQGKVCADGQCLASCESTTCAAGFSCNKGVCEKGATTVSCARDAQCTTEAPRCAAGACVTPCAGDAECGGGRFCDQGACVTDTRPTPNCTDDAQCGGTASTPKRCLGGFCKYTCSTAGATGDAYCRTIDSRIGYCAKDLVCRTAAEANAACTSPSDCSNGTSCIDNTCR